MKIRLVFTGVFFWIVLRELAEYLLYIIIAPIGSAIYELLESLRAFPYRAIGFAWKRYVQVMKTGEIPSRKKERLN